MTTDMLAPAAVHALRNAMHARLLINYAKETELLCDWCQRAFDQAKPRYLSGEASYCSLACRELDEEVVE